MAINRADVRVDLIPDFIQDKDRLLADLSHILALTPEDVQRIRTDLEGGQGFQPVPVAEHLDAEHYNAIKVRELDLPGVSVLEGFSRFYPAGGEGLSWAGIMAAPKSWSRESWIFSHLAVMRDSCTRPSSVSR